jgi:hypothetical protein
MTCYKDIVKVYGPEQRELLETNGVYGNLQININKYNASDHTIIAAKLKYWQRKRNEWHFMGKRSIRTKTLMDENPTEQAEHFRYLCCGVTRHMDQDIRQDVNNFKPFVHQFPEH